MTALESVTTVAGAVVVRLTDWLAVFPVCSVKITGVGEAMSPGFTVPLAIVRMALIVIGGNPTADRVMVPG